MGATDTRADYLAAEIRLLSLHGLEALARDVPVAATGSAHVLDIGSGPPLLFLPGGGATAAAWAPLLARMDGYRCIAVDRPGFGLTPRVDLRERPLRQLAVSFVTDVLDALELPSAVIVANSMGSWWSIRFAQAFPDRARALVHIGCPALLLETSAPAPMRLLGVRGLGRVMQAAQRASRAGVRSHLQMSGDELGRTEADDALADVIVAMERMPYHDRAWPELMHAVVRPRGSRPGMSITGQDLRGLAVPTLYVWGERDTFGDPPVGERAARLMPDAGIVRIAQGHVPWVSDAAAVAAPVRDWLATRGLPGA